MMGRGAEGGTHQIPRIPSVYGSSQQKVHNRGWGVDIYSQALKALALKSPFRDEHEHVGIGALPLPDDPLSLKISSSVDNRRKNRAKKTQARGREGGPTSKKRDYVDDAAGDSTPGQFWMQMDDYFREVTALDIQLLLPTTFPLFDSAGRVSDSCLLIPALGRHYLDTWAEEDANQAENVSQQFVKGVKRKILATSPVSKKSKKMSGEVVTTVISPLPDHEDEEELCHVCNGGDSDEMNQILFCDICNVAVHQDCYGVRQVPEGQWLCSWCSRKVMRKADSDPRECVLCPGRGGALKPVAEAESKGGVSKRGMKFAHLFCCQWVPETYIGNMEAMEPIRNVEGVCDERRRLLCSVCKEKQGACIQCSHGLCATAFHPLCAREAKLWMEVSSREDSEEVDLRAYCPKHTSARKGKAFVSGVEGSEGGSTQMKSPGDEDIKKASDHTIPTPAGFPSDVKTYVTGKGTKHAVSPHDTVVSPATEQQSTDLENGVLHPLAVSRNPDKEQSQEPNVTSRSVEKVMGSRGLELSGNGNCVIGAEQSGIGIRSVSQVPNPGGDGVNAVESINHLKQDNEQNRQMASGTETNAKLLSHSSPIESTFKKAEGGRSSSSKTKLSLHGRRSSTAIPTKDGCSQLAAATVSDELDNEGIKSQTGDLEALEGLETAETFTDWADKGSEEHQLCILSGEVSTSQSHASSPADSPAVGGQASSLRSHEKDAQDAMEPLISITAAEPPRVSRPCSQKNKNLPELGHNLTGTGARKGKVTDSGGKGISRKCRRQSALRSDIGKLSIANGNKVVRLQADANSQGSRPEVESEEVASDEMAAVTGRGEFDTKPNEDAPVLPTSGAQKEDGAKTCSQDAALEAYEDTSKHQVQQDIDMKVGGFGASGLECKHVFVSQSVNSPDSDEEVSQNPATKSEVRQVDANDEYTVEAPTAHVHPYLHQRLKDYQPSCDTAEDISLSGEDDHFNCKVKSELEHCILIPELSANLIAAEDAFEQLEREVVVSEVGAKETWGSLERQWEQLQAAQSGGFLKFVPDDEIECEILVLQDKLLSCAQVNRVHCERVIRKVIPHVAEERAVSRRHGQDLAVVQYYLSQAREAKKQGRKEKREKEAQAVVAAATAAAAASPRVGYVKRDASVFDTGMGIMPQEIAGSSPGLLPNSLRHLKPPVPKPPRLVVQPTGHPTNSARSTAQIKSTSLKPTALTRIAVLRTGAQQSQLQEGSSLCDVCHNGLSSRLNKIVTCDQCKVAVHQDCYGIACIPLGVWRCQPCAELQRQYQNVTSPDLEAQAQQWVHCAICAGQGGALKCTTDGRWVHVFCALWMPETIVGKDESATIQGMENVPSERYALLCSICHQQEGACLTCNFGHCHGAFHPSCARQSGLFMNIKASSGGRIHYRAYCEKHSPQQRAKAELKQRSSYDHMHTLRQIRVELERVRLICERICRRERLKRDVMQSNKEVYLSQLQCAWQTAFGDMEQPQVSEQSWMNGNTVTFPQEVSLATMQEMAASQRDQSADKKARDETKEHSKKHKKYKHADTKLHREKLMTPTEASMQNMRLPKGYAYVPVDVYVKGTMAAPHPDELEKGHLATSVPSHLP